MEDLPGDLEKEIAGRSLPKPSKHRPKWTLLFVGDDGRTRSVRPFKGLFYMFVGILAISLAANGILYVFHRDVLRENRRLTGEMNQLQQQVDTLRYDKDVMMARMVMAQSRSEDPKTKPEPPKPPATTPPEPKASPKVSPQVRVETVAEVIQPDEPTPTDAAVSVEAGEPPGRVSVDELRISRAETTDDTILVSFHLRKIDAGSENVSGHAFVVLRLAEGDKRNRRVTIPWASLTDGTPSPTSRGQYFSISRFKPMKFERRNVKALEQFSRLTVYVFDPAGGLLLEEDFPIEIPALSESAPSESAPSESVPSESVPSESAPSDPALTDNETG